MFKPNKERFSSGQNIVAFCSKFKSYHVINISGPFHARAEKKQWKSQQLIRPFVVSQSACLSDFSPTGVIYRHLATWLGPPRDLLWSSLAAKWRGGGRNMGHLAHHPSIPLSLPLRRARLIDIKLPCSFGKTTILAEIVLFICLRLFI